MSMTASCDNAVNTSNDAVSIIINARIHTSVLSVQKINKTTVEASSHPLILPPFYSDIENKYTFENF